MHDARARWLAAHPYLDPVARLQELVEGAARSASATPADEVRWEAYWPEYAAGIPLLRSRAAAVDGVPHGAAALELVLDRVASAPLSGPIPARARELREALSRSGAAAAEAVASLGRGGGGPALPHPGLVRFLGWSALAGVLRPVVEAFGARRDEASWGRGACPTCGALPVLAQLAGPEAARQRRLACGPCGTRWAFPRLGCPHCGNAASDRLAALEIEGEGRLRLDVCEACQGYLKTYEGEGDEALFLADWPTLHLDVLARDRGLVRRGASLYDP